MRERQLSLLNRPDTQRLNGLVNDLSEYNDKTIGHGLCEVYGADAGAEAPKTSGRQWERI